MRMVGGYEEYCYLKVAELFTCHFVVRNTRHACFCFLSLMKIDST